LFDLFGLDRIAIDRCLQRLDLRDVSDDLEMRETSRQNLARNCTGGDTADRFARGGTTTAPPIANAVLRFVSEVGV